MNQEHVIKRIHHTIRYYIILHLFLAFFFFKFEKKILRKKILIKYTKESKSDDKAKKMK